MQIILKIYPLLVNWYLCDEFGFPAIQMFRTKHEAIMFARSFAYDQDTEIIIHDKKWNVECIESYVRKPIEQQVANKSVASCQGSSQSLNRSCRLPA